MPDLLELDEPASEPVDPVDPDAPVDPEVEPELVVSDELPVLPLGLDPLIPLEPVPPEPVVPLLVEPEVLPLPIEPDELPEPGVALLEPEPLGEVDVVDELVPVSRPSVRLRSEHAPRANVASAAATATPIACVLKCFIIAPVLNAGRVASPSADRPGPQRREALRGDP